MTIPLSKCVESTVAFERVRQEILSDDTSENKMICGTSKLLESNKTCLN